jgi:DNA-binding response OmpR family regulator
VDKRLSMLQHATLLYAEDDAELRESMVRILSCYFQTMYVACDGAEAIALFDAHGADVAILDIRMPKLSGLDVAHHLRAHDEKMPIFIMSSYHEHQELIASIRVGVMDYLLKPFELDALNAALLKCVHVMDESHRLCFALGEEMVYDKHSKTLYDAGLEVKLSKSERIILELLLDQKGKAVSYEAIEEALMPVAEGTRGSIKNIISKLRQKLKDQTIDNVQFVGYILR